MTSTLQISQCSCSDLDPSKQRHNGVPDDGIVSCVTALGCLRSPPISSIIADVKNARSNQSQHRCLAKVNVASAGPATSTAFDDLIHLPGPLTEDAVLKCLQARFCAKQYHVRSNALECKIDKSDLAAEKRGKIRRSITDLPNVPRYFQSSPKFFGSQGMSPRRL